MMRFSLPAFVLVFALTSLIAPACALIAGLEEHELRPADLPDGGSGGSGSSASSASSVSSASSGTGGGAGGSGSGGSTPISGAWPDSPTLYCSNGTTAVACPSDTTDPVYGQDSSYIGSISKYELDQNGLHVTDSVTGITWRRDASVPQTHEGAIDYCSGLSGAGSTYRLPTREELVSLVDYGALSSKISATAFPDLKANDTLWASSVDINKAGGTWFWIVGLGCVTTGMCKLGAPGFNGQGATASRFQSTPARALCVLEEQSPPPLPPLVPPGAGDVITDPRTGLVWERKKSVNGMDWGTAIAHCQAQAIGGHVDWRLPSIKELQTIVDDDGPGATYWPIINGGYLWSSTPSPNFPDGAYVLLGDDGSTKIDKASINYYSAVCVRAGL